jgi:hypothetical protein
MRPKSSSKRVDQASASPLLLLLLLRLSRLCSYQSRLKKRLKKSAKLGVASAASAASQTSFLTGFHIKTLLGGNFSIPLGINNKLKLKLAHIS